MIAFDVNVLVYAHRAESERHAEYLSWLHSLLNGSEVFGVSDQVLAGFLRVVTHPKIFKRPTKLDSAVAAVESIRASMNFVSIGPGERHWAIFVRLCSDVRAKGNLISDAAHAAVAIENNCDWLSADRHFAAFKNLRYRHPLD